MKSTRRAKMTLRLFPILALVAMLALTSKSSAIAPSEPEAVLPEGCSMEETYGVYRRFAQVYNEGDIDALMSMFPERAGDPLSPSPDTFAWYTVTTWEAGEFGTSDLSDLRSYFEQRIANHERLTFHSFDINITDPPSESVGVTFHLTRTSRDLQEAERMLGKTGIDCTSGRINVLAMGAVDYGAGIGVATPGPTPTGSIGHLTDSLVGIGAVVVTTTVVNSTAMSLFPGAAYVYVLQPFELQDGSSIVLVVTNQRFEPAPDGTQQTQVISDPCELPDAQFYYVGQEIAVWYPGDNPQVLDALEATQLIACN
jgi:hypothetical protein